MVNYSRGLSMICLFILSVSATCSFAEEILFLTVDKTQSNLGRPVRVELYGISLKAKLTDIKLSSLKKDFGVISDYSTSNTTDERWPGQHIQILRLKLYPRHIGQITIPRLSIKNVYSQEQVINILPGDTGLPQLTLSSTTPYERQLITVHVTVTSTDSTSRLEIKDNSAISGFDSVPLAFKRSLQQDGSYLLNIGWALSSLQSGRLNIELPEIEYSVSGVARKKFFLPVFQLHSKKLPAYLPPTIPVGKVSILSRITRGELKPTGVLIKNALTYWDIQMQGEFISSYNLPPVLRQIKSNKHLKILPINTTRSTAVTDHTQISSVIHSIPFKTVDNGFLKLPEIRLQYFDPLSGKLRTIIHQADSAYVLSIFWFSLLLLVLLILLGGMIVLSYQKYSKYKRTAFLRRQATTLLQKPDSIADITKSIKLLSAAENWPVNVTLNTWGNYWRNSYETDVAFENVLLQLSSFLYGHKIECDLKNLSRQLLHQVEERKKR